MYSSVRLLNISMMGLNSVQMKRSAAAVRIQDFFREVEVDVFLRGRLASEPATQEGETTFMYGSHRVGFGHLSSKYSDDYSWLWLDAGTALLGTT